SARAAAPPGPLRPPATPLVTNDPYMSVWSFSDHLYDSWPVHWTGQVHAMAGMIRVDATAYRFMGPEIICARAVRQLELRVMPTQTTYRFAAGPTELTVEFTTPMLPDHFNWLTCPVTFVRFEAKATDGQPHRVALYFDASAEWVVNQADEQVTWQRLDKPIAGRRWLSFGSVAQPILEKSGDNIRIDWGYFYLGVPDDERCRSVIGFADTTRSSFVGNQSLPRQDDADQPRPANQNWPVLACEMDLGAVNQTPAAVMLALAYNDIYSIEYMHQKLRPWWYKQYLDFDRMLADCVGHYETIRRECAAFDEALTADARQLGGEPYARLVGISYRHTLASGKAVVAPDGTCWYFNKECFSNGCMATVDVSYPASPFFALMSPTLLRGMIMPILDYAESGKWPFEFAPHDIGQYPKGNGQVYNRTRREGQMPVEECGNMILMTAQFVRATGKADFARRHWAILTQWADYLKAKGLDPENQLCTDDFTGNLAHNTNLSLKAINAIGAYGMMCEMLGNKDDAQTYRQAAKEMATQWQQMAADGDHYRLTFDKPGTWSMKYNLVWDRLLGLGLFGPDVARTEVAYYLKIQNPYGLPLDNRADFTKSDWLVWCATLAEDKEDFQALIGPLYRFVHESPDRVPFSDWYFTSTAKVRGFRARPVIGGIFIPFLRDGALWQKWARRENGPGGRGSDQP
ncbi:MAG: DUF4965 domain-containing protein, partial [Sedimentisphaerales bacterium]|nr:DUF4965 domain-containing protein [Sedimentisphaerales bacterium]